MSEIKATEEAPQKNLGGRPKGALGKAQRDIRDLARRYSAEAVQIAAKLMRGTQFKTDKDTKIVTQIGRDIPFETQMQAIKFIVERAHGKAPQAIFHAHTYDLSRLSDDQLAALRRIADSLSDGPSYADAAAAGGKPAAIIDGTGTDRTEH